MLHGADEPRPARAAERRRRRRGHLAGGASPAGGDAGTSVDVAGTVAVPPGGEAELAVVAHASAGAVAGRELRLRRPAQGHRDAPRAVPLPRQRSAARECDRAPAAAQRRSATRAPAWTASTRTATPPRPSATRRTSRRWTKTGAENVYVTSLDRPAVNIGVSVLDSRRRAHASTRGISAHSTRARCRVTRGRPVDVNALTFDYLTPIGAAGASFPRQGRYYVAVDSGLKRFTDRERGGRLRPSLLGERRDPADGPAPDDARVVRPADARLPHARLAVGRRSELTRDRLSTASWSRPRFFDHNSGLAVFALPSTVPALRPGTTQTRHGLLRLPGGEEHRHGRDEHHAEHAHRRRKAAGGRGRGGRLATARRPGTACVKRQRLAVAASSPGGVASVRFFVDGRRSAVVKRGVRRHLGGRPSRSGTASTCSSRPRSARRAAQLLSG